jgi:23S rRNA (guanine745-N1)-methyltransferase
MWICPACQAPLLLVGSQWKCQHNHCYDKAKAGYVNLLLANRKSRPDPGDNKQMITARRAFLEEGHYHLLAETIADLIANQIAELVVDPARQQLAARTLLLYDAGCGEGYYLDKIVSCLGGSGLSISGAGNDISRAAIAKAARKYKQLDFAIASNFAIPVAAASQDVVLQIFAPASEQEMHRILAANGIWLQVSPAQDHLCELRAALYETPQSHAVETAIPAGFEQVQQSSLSFKFHLPNKQSRQQLLMMTPYYWSAKEGAMEALLENMSELSADFSIRLLRKCSLS